MLFRTSSSDLIHNESVVLLHHSYMEVVGITLKREDAICPRYIAKTITHILLFDGSFLRSHVQNKRKRFDDFLLKSGAKIRTFSDVGKFIFFQPST